MDNLHCDANLEPMYYLRSDTKEPDLPRKLYVEPTSLCNLNCSICFRRGWIDETVGHMDLKVFDKLACEISSLPSVEEIFFGGMGEPLFHPDIVHMLRALPNDRKKTLLTNGTLLSAERSSQLIEAGLSELWVSMDGFRKDVYENIQLGSQFDLIQKNLQDFNLLRAGTKTRLGLTFVVTPENMDQLDEINTFADRFAADELNISHMIPAGPVPKERTLYLRDDISVGKMQRYAPLQDPQDKQEEYVCPFISKNASFVRWDGEVIPCMQLLHSCYTWLFEEKRRITSFSYGSIRDRAFMDCWNDPSYVQFRERVRVFYFPFCTVCWGCEDRKENLTDCAFGKAPTCGACLWATGKIFCP